MLFNLKKLPLLLIMFASNIYSFDFYKLLQINDDSSKIIISTGTFFVIYIILTAGIASYNLLTLVYPMQKIQPINWLIPTIILSILIFAGYYSDTVNFMYFIPLFSILNQLLYFSIDKNNQLITKKYILFALIVCIALFFINDSLLTLYIIIFSLVSFSVSLLIKLLLKAENIKSHIYTFFLNIVFMTALYGVLLSEIRFNQEKGLEECKKEYLIYKAPIFYETMVCPIKK